MNDTVLVLVSAALVGWGLVSRRAARADLTGPFDFVVGAALADRLTFHGLRHTAASLAVQAGANVKAVQTMLGHASAT